MKRTGPWQVHISACTRGIRPGTPEYRAAIRSASLSYRAMQGDLCAAPAMDSLLRQAESVSEHRRSASAAVAKEARAQSLEGLTANQRRRSARHQART
eukprot:4231843-Alexandrium_andersonii.AAC.1